MSTETPNFTHYVDEVQRMFKACCSLDDQTEHRNAIELHNKYKDVIQSIGAQVSQQMPFEAKQQALNTAVEIAGFICIEGDRSIIGKAMREDLPRMPFSATVSHILDMLLPEELAALQADGEIPRALQNLRRRFEAFALDLRIDDSIDRLWLEESDQEDDDRMAF